MRFLLGDWAVDPASNSLSRGQERRQLEPRAMQVLAALSRQPGQVCSAEQLLAECWPELPLGDNPVHKTIAQLRRALDDSATEPRYIETIRKRGYRLLAPVRSADGAAPLAREGGWRGGSPFRGLRPFDAEHAEVFFGRELALQQLLATLRCQWRERRAFTLVLGPSGSGKTSLVLAGLFPALRGRSQAVLDLGDLGSQQPLLALAATLLDWEGADGRGLFPGASAASLAGSLAGTPQALLAELPTAAAPESSLLLFIDRLEALFVAPHVDAFARRLFLDALQALADSGAVIVVAACRNDFYPQLAGHALLMRDKAQGGHFDLAPPSRGEIAQMIRLPARAAGLVFGSDPVSGTRLDDQLCDDAAASPDALPLLQYTLEELYRRRGPHGELRFEVYRELGGLDGAIGRRAEGEIAALLPIQQQALPQVLALLVMLPGEGQGTTGRRALWQELAGPAERELVQALVDARLLVSDLGEGEQAGFRVAHEAILRRWPRVTEWIAAHRQALQLRSRLRQQVQHWQAAGRATEYLLPKGRQLAEAAELLARREFALSAAELAFVQASQRRAARGDRLRAGAILTLSLLLLLSASLAWRAQRAEDLAQQRRAQADALLSYLLGDFAEKLRPVGRLELLDSVGSQALAHLAATGLDEDASARLQRARALTVIGEVRVGKRELEGAVEPLQAALRLLADGGDGSPAWLRAQGAAEFWLGHVRYNQRRFDAARHAFEAYLAHSEAGLSRAPEDAEAMVELSYAQNSLGTLLLDSGELSAATPRFRASIELKQRVLARRPDDLRLRADWADSLSWLGTALMMQGEFEQARTLLQTGVAALARTREAAPRDLEWAYREAIVRTWLGTALQRLQGEPAARAEFVAAQALLRPLLEREPGNRRWWHWQAKLEALLAGPDSGPAHRARLLESLDRLDAQEAKASDAISPQRLGLRAQLLRALARLPGPPEPALERLTPLLDKLSDATRRRVEDLRLHGELAQTRLALAGRLWPAQREHARAQCASVIQELGQLPKILRVHFEITEAWVHAHSCLGRQHQALNERSWLARLGILVPDPFK